MITLRWEESRGASGTEFGYEEVLAARLYFNGEPHRLVQVRATTLAMTELERLVGADWRPLARRWAFPQLDVRAEFGEFAGDWIPDIVFVDIELDDVPSIVSLQTLKPCRGLAIPQP